MTVTRKIILGAVAAVVALFALWFLLLWGPQGGKLADAQAAEDASSRANSELTLRRDRLAAAQDRLPSLQADLARLEAAVPDEPKLAEFLLEANDAATAAGVDFLSVAPAPPSPATDPALPQSVNLSITVDGGYFQVLDYLDRLSDMERIVVVDTLGLAPAGEADGPIDLSVTLTARMFTSEPVEVPATETPLTVSPVSTEATTTTTAPEATS